jgi:hypothetical protein
MTTAVAVFPPAVVKEIRALLPTYAAALVAVVVGSFSHSYTLIATGLLAFAFGSVALGAQSFGHEYNHRTLGLLLSQPLDRRRLFMYKLAVLFVMLLTLTAATLLMFHDVLQRAASPHTEPSMFVLAAACGLFVAPWLTLLCRSTLAAIVFTIAIPGLLATGSDLAGVAIYGLQHAAEIDRFKLLLFWRAIVVICAVGAVASWRMFMRLEVIEGHGPDVQFPESLRGRSDARVDTRARQHHRARMILAKELRLHQMAFVVAALFALLWVATASLERSVPDFPSLPLNAMSMLYAGVLAMLIGSMASADERQMGTAEWQMLLPMPAWQQWVLKAGVALGLAVLLGVVLPAALRYLSPAGDDIHQAARAWRETTAMVVVLTACSLYVSSLCTSGVRALVLSFPTVVALLWFVGTTGELLFRLLLLARLPPETRQWLRVDNLGNLSIVIGGGLVALLLWLASRNHRWADRSAARTVTQVLAITGYITAGLAVLILLGLR